MRRSSGGVSATRLDQTSARIEAQGNGYTPQDTVRDYLLLRAAEETLSAGYGHFEIVDQDGVAYVRGTQPLATHLKITIRMHPGPKPSAGRGFDARETATLLGARYKK